jgi:hypothetical protein
MRHFDYDENEHDDEEEDDEEFFTEDDPSDLSALKIVHGSGVDYDLLFAAINIGEKNLWWKFKSSDKKLNEIARIFAGLKEIVK